MNFGNIKSHNNIDAISILILLIPTFIVLGNFSINLSSLLIIILGISKFFKKLKEYFLIYKKLLLVLFLFFIINIFFSSNFLISLKGILGLIKYILLSIILYLWLQNDEKNIKFFLFSVLFLVLFVSLSVFIEFFYLNFISSTHKSGNLHYTRISGVFFDEKIAGSYISKLLCIVLIFFSLDLKKLKLNKFKISFFIIISYFAIIISLDRMPIIMISLGLFIFLIFTNKLKFYFKVNTLLSSLILFFIIYIFSPSLQLKVIYTFKQVGLNEFSKLINKKNYFENFQGNQNFFQTKWGSHFITAYEMGKNSLLVGNGIKTFRKDCGKKDFESETFNQGSKLKRCSTHPHNIYFELFAETGIIGLFIFLYFHFLIIRKIILTKNDNNKLVSICMLFVLFFPIQTTGSYFSTFNGIYYFLNLSLIAYICDRKKFTK